jgi:tetratricopeptide (TPR) repeat protein
MPRKAPAVSPPRSAEGSPPTGRRSAAEAPAPSRTPLWVGLGLVAAVLIGYSSLFGSDAKFYLVDDDEYVVQNPHVNTGLSADNLWWALTAFHSSNWHPLTWISLQVDSELDGPKSGESAMHAGVFHFTNAILHAAAAIVLMLALARMTGEFWRSALVAALFALHPLRVESVAWVTERKDVLGALFWALTMLAYEWYARRPGVGRYLAVAASLALGLMSKPLLVTLPFALLLLDYWPLKRADSVRAWRRLIIEKLPLLALVVGACALTLMAQGVVDPNSGAFYPPKPLGLRLLNVGRDYVLYVGKTFWPVDLAPMYSEPNDKFPLAWAAAATALIVAVTAVTLFFGRRRPYLTIGWLWYLGTLVPMSGIVSLGILSSADRYSYIPHIGFFIMLVWGLGDVLAARLSPRILMAAAGIAVGACFLATWLQANLWNDSVALLERAVRAQNNNFGAHALLGSALLNRDRVDEAITEYRASIQIEPSYAVARYKLGVALARREEWAEAAESERAALSLAPRWPQPKTILALCETRLGRWHEAAALLAELSELEPERSDLHWNFGVAQLHAGNFAESEHEAREALRLDPGFRPAHQLLGLVYAAMGRPTEAQGELEASPHEVTNFLYIAWALHAQGKIDEARQRYRQVAPRAAAWLNAERRQAWQMATDRDPKHRNGALALLKAEVVTQATEEGDANALDTLAAAQAELGRFDAAVPTAGKALAVAEKAGDSRLAAAIVKRRQLYEQHHPYRE